MWEMQVLSSQRGNSKSDEASGESSSGAEYTEDRLSGDTVEGGPESPQDEHPALRGVQPGKLFWALNYVHNLRAKFHANVVKNYS